MKDWQNDGPRMKHDTPDDMSLSPKRLIIFLGPWILILVIFFFVNARQINRSACDHNRERMQNQSTSDFLTVKWILFFDWIAKLITTLTVCNRKGPYALLLRHDFLLWLFSELIFFSNCFSTRLLIMHVRGEMVLVITHQIKTLTTLHLLAWQKKTQQKEIIARHGKPAWRKMR